MRCSLLETSAAAAAAATAAAAAPALFVMPVVDLVFPYTID